MFIHLKNKNFDPDRQSRCFGGESVLNYCRLITNEIWRQVILDGKQLNRLRNLPTSLGFWMLQNNSASDVLLPVLNYLLLNTCLILKQLLY
jgi:hypothetical protein